MIFSGSPLNSLLLNFFAAASSSKSNTIGRFHFSNAEATFAMSFRAWLVGSCPTPTSPVMKYPRPVCDKRLTSEPSSFWNLLSESKLPITVTAVGEVRSCIATSVVFPFSTEKICIADMTPPLASRVPLTRTYCPASSSTLFLNVLLHVVPTSGYSNRDVEPSGFMRLIEKWL